MPAPTSPKKTSKGLIFVIVLVGAAVLAVPCIGVLAAVAVPAFIGYLTRAKTAEAEANLRSLHAAAASYYAMEHYPDGGGEALSGCVVPSARTENIPGAQKTLLPPSLGPSFDDLGFAITDPIYYQYEIVSVGGCGHGPNEPLYSFRAHGDLDGDGVQSLYEISAGSDDLNELTHPVIYRENELE